MKNNDSNIIDFSYHRLLRMWQTTNDDDEEEVLESLIDMYEGGEATIVQWVDGAPIFEFCNETSGPERMTYQELLGD